MISDCLIKLIIFDIGGVLVDFTEDAYIHYLHSEILPDVSELDLTRFIMPLIVLMELGLLNVTQLERMMAKHFKKKNLDLHWVQGFKRIAKPKMGVIRIANQLNKKYRTVLLTNVSYSRYDELKDSYLKLVDTKKVYESCVLRLRKPQPQIYEYVLKKEGVKPKEAVFIDNQIENVIGAERVGINAVWFRDQRRLMEDLKELKVL